MALCGRVAKRIGCVVLIVVILTMAAVLVGCNKVRVPDGFCRVTFNFNGADGEPETVVSVVEKGTEVVLPEPVKKGYGFVGWEYNGLTLRSTVRPREERITLNAVFERDYAQYSSAVVLLTDKEPAIGYKVGEYKNLSNRVSEIYVSGGYKATLYSRENFKGKAITVAYKKTFSKYNTFDGQVKSMKIERMDTDVAATYEEEITDEMKVRLLYKFAPRFYWAKGEEFFASSVEDAKNNMVRTSSDKGYYYEMEGIRGADDRNAFLLGDMTKARTYAFAAEKEFDYLDLVYFVYCPYNYGKDILGLSFGNHVGDWEHVTVRLWIDRETHSLRPVIMEFSTHSFRSYYSYDEVEQEDGHPVAYIAEKSHGFWSSAGEHTYINAVVVQLKDRCEKGKKWDAWEQLETYSYDALTFTGKGIGRSEWNTCFDKDYGEENSDAVYRWGNDAPAFPASLRMNEAPTGPQEKPVLYNYYTLNSY